MGLLVDPRILDFDLFGLESLILFLCKEGRLAIVDWLLCVGGSTSAVAFERVVRHVGGGLRVPCVRIGSLSNRE